MRGTNGDAARFERANQIIGQPDFIEGCVKVPLVLNDLFFRLTSENQLEPLM